MAPQLGAGFGRPGLRHLFRPNAARHRRRTPALATRAVRHLWYRSRQTRTPRRRGTRSRHAARIDANGVSVEPRPLRHDLHELLHRRDRIDLDVVPLVEAGLEDEV